MAVHSGRGRKPARNFQFVFVFLQFFTTVTSSENGGIELEGDIILGGLFPLHKKSNQSENACGLFSEVPGYQYMEAMLFAINEVNADPKLLPNISLGAHIYDTCQSKTIAADAAKQFIKMTLDTESKGQLAGVVGALSSGVSETVANFLRVFEIPQISYASTSISLSNKDIYSYFLRVVAPDSFQAQAMVDIIKRFGWNYVATVNSAGAYGTKGMEEFWETARRNGICIDIAKKLDDFPSQVDYENTIKDIYGRASRSKVAVLVVFGTQNDIRKLLEAALKQNTTAPRRFTWIGSDGWSNRFHVVETAQEAALGALTIMMRTGDVSRKFKRYFSSFNLTNYPRKNKRYFHEFWQNRFQCRLPETNKSGYRMNSTNCHGNESLTNIGIEYSPVRVVINAVTAYAHALDSLQKEMCPNQTGICPKMSKFKRSRLLDHLKNVSFWDPSVNATIKFDKNQEVSAMYDVTNFRKHDGGRNKYVRVGKWDGEILNGEIKSELVFDESIKWLLGETDPPASYCTENCSLGQTLEEMPGFNVHCCWECKSCEKLQIVLNNTCMNGLKGWIPNANRTGWVKRKLVYPKWRDGLSIAIFVVLLVSLISTLFVLRLYIVYKTNRLLKASGRELCFVTLIGIVMCFTVPVLFIAKPCNPVCYARNLMSSLALAMCYAPLFMKINRIYRIFTLAKSSVVRPALVTPRMQLLITFGLVTIQLMFTALWFTAKPVLAEETYYSNTEELVLECKTDELGFAVNLSYVMLLMILCTIYAFKTRNFPKNFNESKYIGVTMYITCAIWTLFFPFYLNTTGSEQQVYLISAAYVIIGLVTLIGLFAQKVYIVYRGTELRNEDLAMTTVSGPNPVITEASVTDRNSCN